jgi:hypothetical protein
LAIGSVTAKGTPEAIAPVLPFEVRATVRNHLAGKIDQWFSMATSSAGTALSRSGPRNLAVR